MTHDQMSYLKTWLLFRGFEFTDATVNKLVSTVPQHKIVEEYNKRNLIRTRDTEPVEDLYVLALSFDDHLKELGFPSDPEMLIDVEASPFAEDMSKFKYLLNYTHIYPGPDDLASAYCYLHKMHKADYVHNTEKITPSNDIKLMYAVVLAHVSKSNHLDHSAARLYVDHMASNDEDYRVTSAAANILKQHDNDEEFYSLVHYIKEHTEIRYSDILTIGECERILKHTFPSYDMETILGYYGTDTYKVIDKLLTEGVDRNKIEQYLQAQNNQLYAAQAQYIGDTYHKLYPSEVCKTQLLAVQSSDFVSVISNAQAFYFYNNEGCKKRQARDSTLYNKINKMSVLKCRDALRDSLTKGGYTMDKPTMNKFAESFAACYTGKPLASQYAMALYVLCCWKDAAHIAHSIFNNT